MKEFKMKLDTSSPKFIIEGSNDQLVQKISELEFALRTEILKNEETQALNMALKEMIESFQFTGGVNTEESTYRKKESVKIGEVLKEERTTRAIENMGVIESEKEMELRNEILNLKEELHKEMEKNSQLEEQIYDLRDINEQANRDLKLAIESVKQAQDLEKNFKETQSENFQLKKAILEIEKSKDNEKGDSSFDKEELKAEFKMTIDNIKNKYEEVLEELGRQNEEKDLEIDELKSKIKEEVHFRRNNDKRSNEFDHESRKELEKLLNENFKLKKDNDDLLNQNEELKGKIDGFTAREIQEIRELKREIEEKNENIQNLISQLEENSINGDDSKNDRENAMNKLGRELEMTEDRMRKNSFQLRMVYSRVNYILKRITGRSFIDKSKIILLRNF